MNIHWEHHLLSPWHPGVLAAIALAAVIAWFIGAATVRFVFRVTDPWRRVLYLPIPVVLIAVFVYVLPALLFEIAWSLSHPKYVQADLWAARRILPLPLVVAVVSAAIETIRRRKRRSATAA